MPQLTIRDKAVLLLLLVLAAAVAALAAFGMSRWALAGLGVLGGVTAIVAYLQFAARRTTLQHLWREVRATNRAVDRVARLAAGAAARARVDQSEIRAVRAGVRGLRSEVRGVRAELRDAASSIDAASRVADSARDGVKELLVAAPTQRAELRGIRVAQLLFSQSIASTRKEIGLVAERLDRLARETSAHDPASDLAAPDVVGPGDGVVSDQSLRQLRSDVRSLEWQIRRQRAEIISDFQATAQLLDRFKPDAPLPPVAGWAMSPAGLLMLTETIVKQGAEVVVECGSGSSTLWMALAMRKMGRGKVIALEHLQEYADRTQEILDAHGVAPWAEVRVAPLTAVTTAEGEFQWYDTEGMVWERPIDLLLVDGPPTTTGTHARYPALAVLGRELRPGAVIVVDDTDRQDEREVISIWEQEFPSLVRRASPGQAIEVFQLGSASTTHRGPSTD